MEILVYIVTNNLYHKNAIQVAHDFLNTFKTPQKEIVNILNYYRMKTVIENVNDSLLSPLCFLGVKF